MLEKRPQTPENRSNMPTPGELVSELDSMKALIRDVLRGELFKVDAGNGFVNVCDSAGHLIMTTSLEEYTALEREVISGEDAEFVSLGYSKTDH